jgi:hypothetical protein
VTVETPTHASTDPIVITRELAESALALERAANRLYRITKQFEGEGEGETWQPGPQLRWLDIVGDELDKLAQEYEDKEKRPPAKEVLQVRAEKRAKRRDPQLWADYNQLHSEIGALQKWISAKKETISARQSALKGERG